MARSDLEKLLARLASGKPVGGVLLYGSDAYLLKASREKLIEAVIPEGMRQWAVARFSPGDDELERALQQAQSLPLLAPRQAVFIEHVEEIEGLEEKTRDRAVAALRDYLDDPAPFTLLVLEAGKLDERMKLFHVLSEKALVVEAALPAEGEERNRMVAGLAQEMARELGVTLEPDAAEDLADLVGGELARAHVELAKLAAYVGDRRRITPADVDLLVVSEKKYSIWQLAELLAGRRRDLALEFLGGVLREGEEPPSIIGALAWMCRTLLRAQELPRGTSVWDATRALNIRKETAEMALRQAHRIPRAQLLEGLRALYEADSRLKSGAAEPRAILEFLVAELTAPPAKAATRA